ncbi:MAG: glycosyl hydrolase 53 family protein, partial [Bacteroidaceae bacterium]|nr:glycosyl hydrolase 53 family protein [Bacteroidaceae bacterium]
MDSTMLAIVHLPDGHDNSLYRSMFDRLTENGAKFDVIGMSCYPRWSHLDITNDSQVTSTINKYISNMKDVQARYHKPVICVETGHYNNQPLQANHFLAEFMKALIDVGAQGCFYWEPESMGGYELGAWDP